MDDAVIVSTSHGRLRGRAADGVATFRGIPYGNDVGGSRRWRRAARVSPWQGVRDALDYGPRAIQPESREMNVTSQEIEDLMVLGGPADESWRVQEEECLTVNVWAPEPLDASWRPVLFWCHGGKYFGETPPVWWFDGESLARREDVVVVTVRHRVGVLGFLHLADLPGGETYGSSGNVGMLDIVDALAWVRDNIAAFGGDPGNVTIFGESGGGLKVSVLLAMSAAKGLFHKAIIQSGAQLDAQNRAQGTAAALALMGELGLDPDDVEGLLATSAERLVKAQINLAPSLVTRPTLPRHEFEPVFDGSLLPDGCLDPEERSRKADVSLLIGTCATEATFFLSAMPDFASLKREQVVACLPGCWATKQRSLTSIDVTDPTARRHSFSRRCSETSSSGGKPSTWPKDARGALRLRPTCTCSRSRRTCSKDDTGPPTFWICRWRSLIPSIRYSARTSRDSRSHGR